MSFIIHNGLPKQTEPIFGMSGVIQQEFSAKKVSAQPTCMPLMFTFIFRKPPH